MQLTSFIIGYITSWFSSLFIYYYNFNNKYIYLINLLIFISFYYLNKIKNQSVLNIRRKNSEKKIIKKENNKVLITDDDLSTVKEKYKLLKYNITKFLLIYIKPFEKKNLNIMKEDIFNLIYDTFYIKREYNEKIVLDTIIKKYNFLYNENFYEIKSKFEKLIIESKNFYISINSVIIKHKVKILFDYFSEIKTYDENIMYTDNNSTPIKIKKCIYPAIFYLYENDNKNKYEILEKALVI